MALPRRIVVIDEDSAARKVAASHLVGLGFQVVEAASGRAGLAEIAHATPDCVVLDLELSDVSAIQILKALAADAPPRPPVVAWSSRPSLDGVVTAMRHGARDFLPKPGDGERLRVAVMSAIEQSDLARDVARIEGSIGDHPQPIVAKSPAMTALVERAERLATVEMPILLVGESGVGKGSIARYLHAIGPRGQKPFVVVPSGDSPATVEQVLFGSGSRNSAFALAQDGILFIESLTSLTSAAQDRLGKVLGDLSAARTGGQAVAAPRIIAAVDRDVAALVESGALRQDLAKKLSLLTVQVPPLRERRADIPDLIQQLAARASVPGYPPVALAPDVVEFLANEPWPGNLRQLRAVVVRAVALAKERRVRLEDLVGTARGAVVPQPQGAARGWMPTLDASGGVLRYDEYEAEIFRFALDRAGGCVSRAAEMLGVGRATMYRKMRSYDIDAPPVSERAIVRSGRRNKDTPQNGGGLIEHPQA